MVIKTNNINISGYCALVGVINIYKDLFCPLGT